MSYKNEIENYLKEWIEIQRCVLSYFDEENNKLVKLNQLMQILNNNITKDKNEFGIFLKLIMNISTNYFRQNGFFDSLETILVKMCDKIKNHFSNNEIFQIFENHKRILLILFQNKIVIIDGNILKKLFDIQIINKLSDNQSDNWLYQKHIDSAIYFYPEIKHLISKKTQKKIENKMRILNIDIDYVIEKRKNGENDSYICELIRKDSLEEFIDYTSRTNIDLNYVNLSWSLFETNTCLLMKYHSLLEYAMFFGSIRIVKYLYCNGVKFSSYLWPYAIHGNNPEIIHFLEEKQISPDFNECLQESIKCFNDDITNYIQNTLIEDGSNYDEIILCFGINNLNFNYFPNFLNEKFLNALYNQKLYTLIELFVKMTGVKSYIKDTIVKSVLDKEERISNCLIKCAGIPNNLFHNCKLLQKINIPFSVTSIGNYAFWYCNSLEEVTLPTSITFIGDSSFEYCYSLIKIDIPTSVVTIGSKAFYKCFKLNIMIPSSLKTVGLNSFYSCKSVSFDNNVTVIPEHMFDGSSSYEINIPLSVTIISSFAFNNCKNLKEITIPSSVTCIKPYAFDRCINLHKITFTSSEITISPNAFNYCSSIEKVVFENYITVIHRDILNIFPYLKTVVIPSSVIYIDDYAFYKCASLQSLTLPSSVKTIGKSAFEECVSLKNITIPSTLVSIGSNAFKKCILIEHLFIPSSVTSIGDLAFNCKSLRLGNGTKNIFDKMFYNYYLLEQISIPCSVTTIGNYTFYGCELLKRIKIPSSIKSIGKMAFSGCSSLQKILILSSEISIGYHAFESCSSVLIQDGTKSIPEKMFSENSLLTKIQIPSSVTHINDSAFYKCTSLKQITIQSPVTSIGSNAFYGCKSLEKITIPSSVTFIGKQAFYCCPLLKELPIPPSLVSKKKEFLQENENILRSSELFPEKSNSKSIDQESSITCKKINQKSRTQSCPHIKLCQLLIAALLILFCFLVMKMNLAYIY